MIISTYGPAVCSSTDGSGARGAEAGDQEAGVGAHAVPAGEGSSDQQPAGGPAHAGEPATTGQDRAGGDDRGG